MLKNINEFLENSVARYEDLLEQLTVKMNNGEMTQEEIRLANYHCQCIESAIIDIYEYLRGLFDEQE